MNRLIEALWDNDLHLDPPQDREVEALRTALDAKLTAAVGADFADKVAQLASEAEAYAGRTGFQYGFCLGGQLMLAVLATDFTPV